MCSSIRKSHWKSPVCSSKCSTETSREGVEGEQRNLELSDLRQNGDLRVHLPRHSEICKSLLEANYSFNVYYVNSSIMTGPLLGIGSSSGQILKALKD